MSRNRRVSFEQVEWRMAAPDSREAVDGRYSAVKLSLARVIQEGVTPRQRQILLAYFYEGKRMPEIAADLGINKSTVSRTLARGLHNISERIKYYRFG